MALRDAVPNFRAIFPEVREVVRAENVNQFLEARLAKFEGVGLFVWDELVARGRERNPRAWGDRPLKSARGSLSFLTRRTVQDAITDAFSADYYNDVDPNSPFAEVTLVCCYPSDIHIADVVFSDNRRPITEDPHGRKFHGLHVFPEFLLTLRAVAGELGAQRLSLLAATRPLADRFKEYGFEPQTPMARMAYEIGQGIPMVLDL